MKKTNFDEYLARRLEDPAFRALYEEERERAHLAVQIREIRRRRGWTQAEFARRLGTSQSAVARLESGTSNGYTVDMLRRIARVTDSLFEIRLEPRPRPSGHRRRAASA